MVYTDNPYVDEMVYYAKKMGLGTVLKLKDLAESCETVESLKAGGLYISCIEGTAIFEEFSSVTEEILISAGIIDTDLINACLQDINQVPINKRPTVTKGLIKHYIDTYEELNSYYRMLHGLPKVGQEDYIENWIPPKGITIDISKPIHDMDDSDVAILENFGVLDDMIDEDPENRQYMRYLGKKKIDYYIARKANRFDPLYIPDIDSDAIYKMYKDKLDENKFYVLRTVYSEAFKYNSDYYDNFISVFIVLITVIDIISRVQEFITRKEIFDIRSVQYIFKSHGVPFFETIPLKYQIAMVKNLHTLLKYKSTSKCMVDICSLFGFDNIKIFKYYLLKDRKVDLVTGDYTYKTDADGNEDLESEYELKFLKLPLEEDLDEYIRSRSNYVDYDEITESDPKWDGGLDHNMIIKEILKEEFNFARTKYISIDTIYDIAKMSMQQSYFFNFLYDNVDLENLLTIKIPYISTARSFKIADVFTLLTALTYKYNSIKDIIMDTQSKVLYVNGFNFKADLATLASEIAYKNEDGIIVSPGTTPHAKEQLNRFISPSSSIPTFKEMMDIFINNMDVRNELIKGMQAADNKAIYDIYKKLYDALMVVELTLDFYKNPETGDFYRDSEGDATYSEFLMYRDSDLYSVLVQIDTFEDRDSRNQYIANLIDSIIYALEEYIDTTEFQALFANLPIMSSEAVKQYIAMVINFYKSYKVDFLGINTIYTLDDKHNGIIKLIDSMEFDRYFERPEKLELRSKIASILSSKKSDETVELIERLYFDIYTWVKKYFNDARDEEILRDGIAEVLVSYVYKSIINFIEKFYKVNIDENFKERIFTICNITSTAKYDSDDDLGVIDRLWFVDENVKRDPFMTTVHKRNAGKMIVANLYGDSDPGSYISNNISDENGNNAVTEIGVSEYTAETGIFKSEVVKKKGDISKMNPSDNKIVSEKAFVDALSFDTLNDD